jgi:hypothetical protein
MTGQTIPNTRVREKRGSIRAPHASCAGPGPLSSKDTPIFQIHRPAAWTQSDPRGTRHENGLDQDVQIECDARSHVTDGGNATPNHILTLPGVKRREYALQPVEHS